MVYSSGSYTIPGAKSREQLENVRERIDAYLNEVTDGFIEVGSFEVKYVVFMEDWGTELDLELVTVHLGLSRTEYEPEQFPAVIFRSDDPEGVILIFASGKMLFTGYKSREAAETVKQRLQEELDVVMQS